ncbi:NUDIX domain-containing protein [Isoptericola sp. NPDC055881]
MGVLFRTGSVLLGLRSAARRAYPGVWDLPGGHVEPGESTMEALARELREELGVEAVVEPRALFRVESGDLALDAHLVPAWSGRITNAAPDEHDDLRFVDVQEFPRLEFAHPEYPSLLTDLVARQRGRDVPHRRHESSVADPT